MEGDPFGVIEGITIAAYATASERGYFYVRGEYPLAAQRIGAAIEEARAAGLLGENILGSGFAFDIELRRGAGAYICGEETALFNSIEGKRGEPRNKPPFPVHVGLFAKPTVINNVETLANIPLIIAEGGAAGMFIGPDKLDVPLTFEGTRAIGATLGSGVVMIFDETVDLADILTRVAAFFRDESCGQCVPCRVGTVRQEELLSRMRSGRTIGSRADELALLKEIGQAMRDASICGLGQTASNAIESAFSNLNPIPGGKNGA